MATDPSMVNLIAVSAVVDEHLVGFEDGADRQQPEPWNGAALGLDRVGDLLPEHLIAATDSEDRPALGGAMLEHRGETAIRWGFGAPERKCMKQPEAAASAAST